MNRIQPAAVARCAFLLLCLGLSTACSDAEQEDETLRVRRVIYNLDSTEFFVGTFGPIEGATIDRFVDEHAALGVTDLFVNVNHQKTNYGSEAWPSGWVDVDFDKPTPEWIRNQLLLHEQGVDYPRRLLQRARQAGMSAWVSIRMNDAHLPDQPDHPLHSAFWRSHPEWHLKDTGLDYEQPEVREHYIRLIREVLDRYDIDGLELDYLRFQHYFRPGREQAGARLMSDFVSQVAEMVASAATRLGHPVDLAVRVPTSPNVSRAHGLEAVEWAASGLIDLIVASPWWESSNTDIGVEAWKTELDGMDVDVAVALEDGIQSGAHPRRTMTPDEVRGLLAGVWHRGADAVYFFNLFTGPWKKWPHADYEHVIMDAGAPDRLYSGPRRHPVTIANPWAPGEPRAASVLPSTANNDSFSLYIGAVPDADQVARVELEIAEKMDPPGVSVNGIACDWTGFWRADSANAMEWLRAGSRQRAIYAVPRTAIRPGSNTVVIENPDSAVVNWVEISIRPAVPGDI